MARYGVQISQQGIDVTKAADYQKVLDSNWKFLDILDEVDIDITIRPSGVPNGFIVTDLYKHNLGYITGYEFRPSSLCSGAGTDINSYTSFLRGDRNNIYCTFLYTGSQYIRLSGKLRVYNINIAEEYESPNTPVTSISRSPVSRYGAKFLDRNRGDSSIDDETMYPFTLNTRGKQLSIHKHGTATPVDQYSLVLNVTHNVGYPPSYMIAKMYNKSDWSGIYTYPYGNESETISVLTQTYYLAKTTATDIEFRGYQSAFGTKHAYIILKDPSEIAG